MKPTTISAVGSSSTSGGAVSVGAAVASTTSAATSTTSLSLTARMMQLPESPDSEQERGGSAILTDGLPPVVTAWQTEVGAATNIILYASAACRPSESVAAAVTVTTTSLPMPRSPSTVMAMLLSTPDSTTLVEPAGSVLPMSRTFTVASPRSLGPAHSDTDAAFLAVESTITNLPLFVLHSGTASTAAAASIGGSALLSSATASFLAAAGVVLKYPRSVVKMTCPPKLVLAPSLFLGSILIRAPLSGEEVAPEMEATSDVSDSDVAAPAPADPPPSPSTPLPSKHRSGWWLR